MNKVTEATQMFLKKDVPSCSVGDTLRIGLRIVEGNQFRLQYFEGILIKKRGSGIDACVTLRKISFAEGVEKTFVIHSPRVESIQVSSYGKVRRAKLLFLRDRVGKQFRVKTDFSKKRKKS